MSFVNTAMPTDPQSTQTTDEQTRPEAEAQASARTPGAPEPQQGGAGPSEARSGEQADQQAGGQPGERADAASRSGGVGSRPDLSSELGEEIDAELDAAMAELEGQQTRVLPRGGYGTFVPAVPGTAGGAKPAIRGPRVVQGGREHRTGTVVSVGPADIFLEFGPKELGVLSQTQYKEGEERPKVGDKLEVVVNRYNAQESLYELTLPGTVQKADWELLEPGQVVEARVTGVNKGGLEMEVAGHPAFMPASQVDINRIPDLSIFVGEKFACTVQRVDRRGKGNIVLSRREVIERERAKAAEGLRETLQPGQTVEGTVRKIMPFGAFVDLGGVDGLIHLSDLAHDRVNHGEKNVARYVTEGQRIRVQILEVDWDANRISLGLKQLQADPFEAMASEVVEGATLTGKVTKILDFGAFVEVAPGVEGLVHISELDWKRVGKVSDVVQENEVVQVKVLKVEPGTRKISLSVKQTKDRPAGPQDKRSQELQQRAEEIKKETPALRRMREQAKLREKQQADKAKGGLGGLDKFGGGLGDLRL